MPAEILGSGGVPPIKYVVYDGHSAVPIGECPAIEVSGTGVVTLTLKDFRWNATAAPAAAAQQPTPSEVVEQLRPALDMFDLLRRELTERGWQPDTGESIAADVAKKFLNEIMKKATE